jgi:YHS domain-containing protein
MDGLLSLLVFAFFFYLMMRMGCGSHMAHGHNEGHHGKEDNVNHVDPVCHMEVNPEDGYGKMFGGRLYRFCSRKCLDKFDENPDQYLNSKEKTS